MALEPIITLCCAAMYLSRSGCKFAQSWSSAVAAAASAAANDSHNGSSDEGLSHAALPCSCVAAVAEPNTVVALLSISRTAYMEVTADAVQACAKHSSNSLHCKLIYAHMPVLTAN
jgi:hypothetical protein